MPPVDSSPCWERNHGAHNLFHLLPCGLPICLVLRTVAAITIPDLCSGSHSKAKDTAASPAELKHAPSKLLESGPALSPKPLGPESL